MFLRYKTSFLLKSRWGPGLWLFRLADMPMQRIDPTSAVANSQLTDRQWLLKPCCQTLCLRWLTHLSGGGLGGKNDSCKDKWMRSFIGNSWFLSFCSKSMHKCVCDLRKWVAVCIIWNARHVQNRSKWRWSEDLDLKLPVACLLRHTLSLTQTHTDTKHTLTPHCAGYPIHQECISQQSYCSK